MLRVSDKGANIQVRSGQLHEHNRICSTIHMSEIGTANVRIDTRLNRVIQLSLTYRDYRYRDS